MLEALIGIALMGLLLAILAKVTAEWVPRWKAGFARAQSADLLGLGLDRIAADVAAAEYVGPGEGAQLLFEGTPTSVTFVRTAVGPNAAASLEIVRLTEIEDARGRVLVRTRAPFAPSVTREALDDGTVEWTNPVVLVRPPFRISFAFRGHDPIWAEKWINTTQLPTAIRITVHDAATGRILPASTATLLNVNAPSECARSQKADCGTPSQ